MLTKDGYILRTRRDKKLAYYAEQYDFSIEEQLNISDIGKEGIRISTWAERMCKEELGIENRNAEGNAIQKVQVASVFYEQDAVNVAMNRMFWTACLEKRFRIADLIVKKQGFACDK